MTMILLVLLVEWNTEFLAPIEMISFCAGVYLFSSLVGLSGAKDKMESGMGF